MVETDLTEADLAALSELLAESMTRLGPEYREQPWRRLRPEFRVIARSGDEVLAQISAFRIGTRPERRLYGLGDLAVRPDARGRGLASLVALACRDECRSRDAEIILADTVALRAHDLRLGYAPIPRFRFYYERDGACRWHPNWHAMIRHPEPRVRLELEEGDF